MEDQKSDIEMLLEKTGDYTRKKVELYKLKVVDKGADVISSVAAEVAIISMAILFFLILNIGVALWLGEVLGKNYYGFFAVAGFYALSSIIFYAFRHNLLKHPIRNSLIKHALKIEQ